MPEEVRRALGHRLSDVQDGLFPANAKPLRGNLSGLLELREDGEEGAFRVVYLVRFPEAVYVLHAFQKKSSHGIGIPQRDLRTILARLQKAVETHRAILADQENA
jgi:phage-related protein